LHRAVNPERDQICFLAATTRAQLAMACFPLGVMPRYAPPRGLAVAEKPDRQDVCLPAGRHHALVGKLRPDAAQPGEFIHANGRVLDQRQGLGQAAWDGSAGLVRVVLDEPGVTARGQACAMYDGDGVLGGGFLRTRLSVDTDRAAA
jgi:tRNA-specific 2-thiouridylase